MFYKIYLPCLSLLSGICAGFPLSSLYSNEKPNVILILADDMGYADISSFGAPDIKTPRIDALAAEGIRFTNAYAMGPECTPSRTALLTGRYPQRVGGMECAIGTGNVWRYDDAIRLARSGELGLPADMAVLAPALKKAGYHNGVFGKWHLGYEPEFSPLLQGFDEFIGFLGGNVDYFRHNELSELDVYYSGTEPIAREGYLTDLITADALRFLEGRAKEPDVPFFLYLPHAAPHFPFQSPDDASLPAPDAENWTKGSRETYLKMMESLDASVGSLLDALAEHGLSEKTLFIFASDHGAMAPGLNTPWRDFKGTLFEGGIRTPIIARWPGQLPSGSSSSQVATLMDLTRSILNAAGARLPQGVTLDGDDLFKHIKSGAPDYSRKLFWRYRRDETTWQAVRDGDGKYIRRSEAGNVEEWLFDLAKDPCETHNQLEKPLSEDHSKRIEQLRKQLTKWEEKVAPVR